MHDLLGEIQGEDESDMLLEIDEANDREPDAEEQFLDQTQKEFEELSTMINKIIINTQSTQKLEKQHIAETTQGQHQKIMNSLDKLISSTMAIAKGVSGKLKENKLKNEEFEKKNPHSTLAAWRINKLNTSALRFQKALQGFNAASDSFKNSLRKKISRQARLVNQDITDEQIEEIVESNDPTAFMQQALMIPDAMLDRVADIEKRHQGILNIEQGVKELQVLWGQLAILVDEQQEHLDHIESNVEQTLNYVQRGKENLVKAQKSQKASRKMAMCMCCGVIIIGAIILMVLK